MRIEYCFDHFTDSAQGDRSFQKSCNRHFVRGVEHRGSRPARPASRYAAAERSEDIGAHRFESEWPGGDWIESAHTRVGDSIRMSKGVQNW